jgi:hypothetical protein
MAADRNQWRAICGSKMQSATKETPPHDKTSGLSSDTALYTREYKNFTEIPDKQIK